MGFTRLCSAEIKVKGEAQVAFGCEVVQGDISDLASMQRALDSVQAAYISIHTLSPQHSNVAGQRFMDVEVNYPLDKLRGLSLIHQD